MKNLIAGSLFILMSVCAPAYAQEVETKTWEQVYQKECATLADIKVWLDNDTDVQHLVLLQPDEQLTPIIKDVLSEHIPMTEELYNSISKFVWLINPLTDKVFVIPFNNDGCFLKHNVMVAPNGEFQLEIDRKLVKQ